jgi:cysteine desulfurase
MKLWPQKNIYLDYASATPIDRRVLKVLNKTEKKHYANASAIYEKGLETREIINKSRSKIAKRLNTHSDEIIFTGSGTESDALAVIGTINFFKNNFPDIKPHVITSAIEHPAILENIKLLENKKIIEVSYIPVLSNGVIDLKYFRESLRENTILVTVMYANNEIGTIQPVEEIAKIVRKYRKDNNTLKDDNFVYPVFHTDACQAMNYLFTENIEKLGVDLMTFNSSKIYGPKGIGVLVKKRGVGIEKIYGGGGQESDLRSGTESASLISSLALALKITNKIKEKENARLTKLRDYGIDKILELSNKYPFEIELNGDKDQRLPNNINITIKDLSSELVIIELSALGIYVSEKSACKSEDDNGSYVIKALNGKSNQVTGSIRITLGRQTTKKDLNRLVKGFSKILSKYSEWK